MSHFPYKIKFPPMAIDGMLAMAIQMIMGHSTPQYHYDKDGSTIEFTANELKEVISYLRDMKHYAVKRNKEIEAIKEKSQGHNTEIKDNLSGIKEIDDALETIRKSVMESKNIAQARKANDLIKKCNIFYQRVKFKK